MRLSAWVASAALLGASLVAHADTITTFDLTTTVQEGSLSGTVQIDTSTGQVTEEDITFTDGSYTLVFSGAPGSQFTPALAMSQGFTEISLSHSGPGADFYLAIPATSLIGYTGGALCSTASPCGIYHNEVTTVSVLEQPELGIYKVTSGELTDTSLPPTAATPEPSSILMLGTGLLGVAGVLRKRMA